MRVFLSAVLCVLSWSAGNAQASGGVETYVGKAGDIFISEQEFTQRFEMLPSLYRHRKPQLEGAKLDLLYSIIAEKLLAQEALARRFDQDSVVQMAFGEVRGLLARDELYRQEVRNKVTITPADIEHGVIKAQLQVLVAFIFFEREEDANFVRVQMKQRGDFERIEIDSSMHALKDTATVIWSDADPVIEEAAYRLKLGEISPVVVAGKGFYILKQLAVQTNWFYASMQPDVLRERVTTKIREKKEQIRASEFVEEILKHKVGRSLSEPFKLLAKSLMDVYKNQARDSLISLNSNLAGELKAQLGHAFSDTLVEVGNARWTIDDVIDRFLSRQFTVPAAEIRTIPSRLNVAIKLMVHQELLGQEALLRGLDKAPAVRRQLEMWHNAYLADMMKEQVRRRVSGSDAEVYAYLKSRDPKSSVPLVQIRELQTNSITEMNEALSDLEQGLSFEQAIEKWSNDPAMKAKKGVSGFFPITERSPVGEIASQMEIGRRYGPVRVPQGVLYFELLARQPAAGQPTDTSFEARKQSAREELGRMKQKRTLDLFLAQIGQERGFMVYEDRLKQIEVSPIPMMTFRLLGFGGRMFAVPFVQKQLDWLDIEPPQERILP
jgi:parvulin-like peptidyl-prolyl isomerase